MKRFALVLTVVSALAVLGTTSANAADSYYGHGYVGHTPYAHGYAAYGHLPRHGYVGHGYAAYGHGTDHHSYAAPAFGGHGYYRSFGHGGGFRISTPHFGLRIGH